LSAAALVAAGVFALAACTSGSASSGESGAPGDSKTIALVTNNQIDPFYSAMRDGAQEAAEAAGYTLNWQAPAEQSAANQTTTLQQVAATKPAGIVFSAADADALAAPLKGVLDSGIPVIGVDSDVADTSARLALIASNNRETGIAAATMAEELLGGSGKVGHVGYTPGVASLDPRVAGWHEQLAEYPGIEDVGDEYAGLDLSENQQKAAALIARVPDISAIFTDWTGACVGTAQAIKQAGKTEQIKLFCADASPDQKQLLESGDITALLVQQPFELGRIATEQLIAYIEDGTAPEDTAVDIVVIDQQQVGEDEFQKYFYG
jgi:ribose transport system substrate-binding protein